MLRRQPGLACFLVILGAVPWLPAGAQRAPQTLTPVRYHLGDDPGGSWDWAAPDLNDSSWPVAWQNQWPRPEFHSDGFVWVRFRVPVRSDAAEPLALRVSSLQHILVASDIFVNGSRVGSFGRVPPSPYVEGIPRDTVFDLGPSLARPGTVALVALRIWYPPFVRRDNKFDSAAFMFDQSRTLRAEDVAVRQRALERNLVPITVNCFILLIGVLLLVLARSSRSPDLLLYGAMLVAPRWVTLCFEFFDAELVTLSASQVAWLQVLSQLPGMIVTVEFIWRIHRFSDVWFKRITYASVAIFNLAILAAYIPIRPSAIVTVARPTLIVGLQAFDILTILANLWAIFFKREKRFIAFAMILVPTTSLVSGFRDTFGGGTQYFDLAFFLSSLILTVVLAREAWKEWRTRDALHSEFETAREMQQRLVRPAVNVPGFRIESVYKPAAHVGGDFFYIRPLEQGGIVVVVGDVSGKGLRAAMTVNLVIGALRTMPPLPPTRILDALNRGLVGQMQGGFVTCCTARIAHDGTATIANAGHLAPYLDGREIELPAAFPLGITAEAAFEESTLMLPPGARLTLITDGVVEARSTSGELFGFDRAAAVASQPADAIAKAAQAFGQEDDITVLTLSLVPVEVARA